MALLRSQYSGLKYIPEPYSVIKIDSLEQLLVGPEILEMPDC